MTESCTICFNTYDIDNNIKSICEICNKQYCITCMKRYIVTKIKEGNISINCLCLDNSKKIYNLFQYLSESELVLYNNIVNRSRNTNNCPLCMFEFYNKDNNIKILCSNCNKNICMKCEKEDHPEYKECSSPHPKIKNTKQCPKCRLFIIKNGGCDHMKCSWCNTHWSYNTGKIVNVGNYNNYNYYNYLEHRRVRREIYIENLRRYEERKRTQREKKNQIKTYNRIKYELELQNISELVNYINSN